MLTFLIAHLIGRASQTRPLVQHSLRCKLLVQPTQKHKSSFYIFPQKPLFLLQQSIFDSSLLAKNAPSSTNVVKIRSCVYFHLRRHFQTSFTAIHVETRNFLLRCWTWTKCKQTQYLIDKSTLGKMDGVYVTYVANVVKEQWHVVTLECTLKVFKVYLYVCLLCFWETTHPIFTL